MLHILEEKIIKLLSEKYDLSIEGIDFGKPPKKSDGDIAIACFFLARSLKKSPQAIADELLTACMNDEEISKICVKGNAQGGYLNLFLNTDFISQKLISFMQEGIYGNLKQERQEHVIVDYIGANVGKPLHIGHMCTPSGGQVIINLFKKLGYNVIGDSHIGDWGIIFGKLIVAYEKYGDPLKLKEDAVEHLFQLYVQISNDAENDTSLDDAFRGAFKELSQGNEDAKKIWAEFTKYSITAMNRSLSRISVHPDYDIGESFYEGIGLDKMQDFPDLEHSMSDIVEELIEKKIAIKNEDNSVGVVFPDEHIPSCILQKRDGTHGYLASDLACIKYRMKNWSPSRILYFVDVRQKLHFEQAFYIAKVAGWLENDTELTHAYNGFISLKDGAMSTRKGKIVKLDALFDESLERAKKIIQEKRPDISEAKMTDLAEKVGIGAIKYGYLKKSRTSDSIFDWDEFLSFEGNSGPYIQYAYVRARKLTRNFDINSVSHLCLENESEKQLMLELLNFRKIIAAVKENYFPHVLCQYAYAISKGFSLMYSEVSILGEEDENLKLSRQYLVYVFQNILEECFEILAIPLPLEM